MANSEKQMKVVLNPVERDGKTYWSRVGVGFVNKDNSINLFLEQLPLNGQLQVRDFDRQQGEGRAAVG